MTPQEKELLACWHVQHASRLDRFSAKQRAMREKLLAMGIIPPDTPPALTVLCEAIRQAFA